MNTITAKIKLLPDANQAEQLHRTLTTGRDAMNFASGVAFVNGHVSFMKLQKLAYHDIRNKFGMKSQMACNICSMVASSYASMETNLARRRTEEKRRAKRRKREPKEISIEQAKYSRLTLQFSYNRDFKFDDAKSIIGITTLDGRIKIPIAPNSWRYDASWEIGAAVLVEKNNKFYLHISLKKDIPLCSDSQIKNIVGVDFGLNFLAMAMDSKGRLLQFRGKHMKNKKAGFKRTRKSLQERKTSSSRQKLKRIGNRENRWQRDVNHCIAKALVDFAGKDSLIVLENLTGIRNVTERVKRKDRYYSVAWAFQDLRSKIEYKQTMNGGQNMAVDPSYTSQKCPHCGHTSRTNRNKKKHIFICKSCGYSSNDDRVAAMNLRQMGIEARSAVSSGAMLHQNGVQSITPRCNTTAQAEPRKEAAKPTALPGRYKPLPSGRGS